MLVQNAYNAALYCTGFPYMTLKRCDGTEYQIEKTYSASDFEVIDQCLNRNIWTNNYLADWGTHWYGAVLGNGTTSPQISDYCLSGTQIYAGFNSNYAFTNNGTSVVTTYTIEATSQITISEIALVGYIKMQNSGIVRCMYTRDIFTPITLDVNDVAQIIYTITGDVTNVEVI